MPIYHVPRYFALSFRLGISPDCPSGIAPSELAGRDFGFGFPSVFSELHLQEVPPRVSQRLHDPPTAVQYNVLSVAGDASKVLS